MMVDIGLKFLLAPSPPRGWHWGQGHGLRSFVKKSQGRSFCVKVYKTSYFEDPLMDLVHIGHDGRYRSKILLAPSPPRGWPWGQGHGLRSFVKKSQGQSFCVKVYKTSYFEDPLMDLVHIWHDGRYRSKIFISTIPTPGVALGSRSRT